MVRTIISPPATKEAAFTYLSALFEAFQHDPEKFQEIEKLLEDITYHRVDLATGIARVKELLKDHRNLLVGFNVFLPAPKLTMDDSRAYVAAVKEAFKDEPKKYDEFLEILRCVYAHSDDEAHCYARVKELMKDHPILLLGFNVFLPAHSKITFPPVANKSDDPFSYITTVKEAFHLEPERYSEFLRLLSDYRSHRLDVVSFFARVDKLMKDYREELLPGFVAFLPDENTGPTYTDFVEKIKDIFQDGHANYEEFEKILIDFRARRVQQRYPRAYNLVAKVKERLQGDDIHVYKSFLQKVRMLREGNMSRDEVYHEIVTLLQDHQDLVKEVSDLFNK